MRLKSFHAATMAEAMRQVRDTLGDDAVIIATRSARGRVEITAAMEPAARPPAAEAKPPSTARLANVEALAQALAFHGVPKRLTERLCLAAATLNGDDPLLALAGALDANLPFDPWPERPARPTILIGPAGAGKTATTARLAARAVLAGETATTITFDTERSGGIAQLATIVELMKQQLVQVESPADLDAAVRAFRSRGPIFIDSFGVNPHDQEEMQRLRRYLSAVDAEPALVLPASGDASEQAEVASRFAAAGAKRLLLTRLDASRRYGAALSAADASRLPISAASITPFVAESLHPLNPVSLARLLLRDPGEPLPGYELDEAAE